VLNYKVKFCYDCTGETVTKLVKSAEIGEIVLLENLRFHSEEELNETYFSKKLASLANAYVNDAFGSAHRAHASTEGTAHFFGNEKYAGELLLNELKYLGDALEKSKKPFVAIIGGSKISGKIDVINNLMNKCDAILIGGGMTFTFLKAMDLNIGNSLLETDKIGLAMDLINKAQKQNVNLVLPVDIRIAKEFNNNAETKIVPFNEIPDGWIGMDIGPETEKLFDELIIKAKTVFWNGPMGVFEMENFANGTLSVAQSLKEATSTGEITVVGGGDSAAAVNQLGFNKFVSHVSTGGGASLEFLEGKILPGVKALEI
jgi:phosphoglycerate kinase